MRRHLVGLLCCLPVVGCATTPPYAVRPLPVPVESPDVHALERAISAQQAALLERGTPLLDVSVAEARRFDVTAIVNRLARVSERPQLSYRPAILSTRAFNAAALADGRVYVTLGMLDFLQPRPRRADELAFVLGHEIGHICAQHVIKRIEAAQRADFLSALASAAAAGLSGSSGVGGLATDLADIVTGISLSGYSQEQELEADQLGIRYLIRAGFNPQAVLDFMADTERFDTPSGFLRTHPYTAERRQQLERYLAEAGVLQAPPAPAPALATGGPGASAPSLPSVEQRREQLRQAQRLYPKGSVSWRNLQQQIDALGP